MMQIDSSKYVLYRNIMKELFRYVSSNCPRILATAMDGGHVSMNRWETLIGSRRADDINSGVSRHVETVALMSRVKD